MNLSNRQTTTQTTHWQRTLYVMFVAQFISAVGFSNIFPFLPLYVQSLDNHTGWSVEFLSGLVFSAQAVTMMIASPIWGVVSDRHGRKLMVERALFGGAIILGLMGFVRSAEGLIFLRLVQGAVTGTVSAANALVAGITPRERSGYAMGLLQVGQWGGVAVGPLIGGAIADAFGYRWAFVLTALLLVLAGLLVWATVQESVPAQQAAHSSKKKSFFKDWQHVLTTQGVGLIFSLRFLVGLGNLLVVPIAPLYIQTLVHSEASVNTLTGLIIGVASGASTATAVYLGRLGDRVGHQRVLMVSALLAGLFYLPQSMVTDAWQLLVLRALTGAAIGGILPTLGALLATYTQPGEEGSVYGLDNSIFAASRAVAPLIGGALAGAFGYRPSFVIAGSLYLLIAFLAARFLPAFSLAKHPPVTAPATH